MKLSKLSGTFLKFMAKEYSKTHNKSFIFQQFKDLYPELDNDFITDALCLLKSDGFVNLFFSDNIPLEIELYPNAIRTIEEDTLLKRGIEFLKIVNEIKDLI